MPKANIYALKRPYSVVTETKTFTDPLQPGVEITLTLRGLTPAETFAALDFGQSMMSEYCGRDGKPPERALPAIDGKIPVPSSSMCLLLSNICYAQAGDVEDRYTFEELVGIAETMPNAFALIQRWSESLLPSTDPKDLASANMPPD